MVTGTLETTTAKASLEAGLFHRLAAAVIVYGLRGKRFVIVQLSGALTTREVRSYHPDMDPTSETYRYIVSSAGVRGGHPMVEGTRIAVHDVVGLLQNGETVDTVRANCFPQLSRSQVYECLAYYEDHRGEIDLLVARQMALVSE